MILLTIVSITIPISHCIAINDFLDIEIYSRGFDQTEINDVGVSFIKINGGESIISSIVYRGMTAIILNETNGNIIDMINSDTFNISASEDSDNTMNNFLLSASPDNIIILTTYDTPLQAGNPPISTLNTLESFGCLPGSLSSSIGERSGFIFIGTPNGQYTYCEVTANTGSAILESFQIPFPGLIYTIFCVVSSFFL